MSQRDLARQIGVQKITIHRIETAQGGTKRDTAEKLAEALGLDETMTLVDAGLFPEYLDEALRKIIAKMIKLPASEYPYLEGLIDGFTARIHPDA